MPLLRRFPKTLICLATLLIAAGALVAHASKPLVVDLSRPVIAITTEFTGTDILLFGTTDGEGDVAVVVRGPVSDQIVRKKEQIAGVWVNKNAVLFADVPFYYAIASNQPLNDIMLAEERTTFEVGHEYLVMDPAGENWPAQAEIRKFRKALIRKKAEQGLYRLDTGNVTFKSDRLFRTELHFPGNIATGTYGIDVYLLKGGRVANVETTLLNVRKFGVEASIYDFAYRHSFSYGLFAIIIAIMAGWAAYIVFRKN